MSEWRFRLLNYADTMAWCNRRPRWLWRAILRLHGVKHTALKHKDTKS